MCYLCLRTPVTYLPGLYSSGGVGVVNGLNQSHERVSVRVSLPLPLALVIEETWVRPVLSGVVFFV